MGRLLVRFSYHHLEETIKLILVALVILAWGQWDNAEDDEVVKAAYEKFEVKALQLVKEKGLHHPFIYHELCE